MAKPRSKPRPSKTSSTLDRDFDAELRAHPRDAELALVYADYLIARGDPRGELIVLQHRIDTTRGADRDALEAEESRFLIQHAEALLGPLVDAAVSWRRGFAQRIELARADATTLSHESARHVSELAIDPVTSAEAAAFMALPRIDQLTRLELLLDDWLATAKVVAAIAKHERPALRSLVLGSTDVHARANRGELYAAWDLNPLVTARQIAELAAATPALRTLELRGPFLFGGIEHPTLTGLTLIDQSINHCPWDDVDGPLDLPKLTRLRIELLKDEYRDASITALTLTPSNVPALRELEISGAYDSGNSQTTMFAALASSAILPQLERLSITDLQPDDVATLRELAPRFAHLEYFSVERLDDAVEQAACRRALPKLVIAGT